MSYLVAQTVGDLSVANTTTETSIYSSTITGGTLSGDKLLEIRLIADWLNNTGGSESYILRVKYGGTTFFTFTSLSELANASRRSIQQTIWLGAASTTTQRLGMHTAQGDVGSDTGTFVLTTNRDSAASNAGTVDSTVNQTLQITVQNSIANANLSFRRRGVFVSVIETETAAPSPPPPPTGASRISQQSGNFSDPLTWGGTVGVSDDVLILPQHVVTYDVLSTAGTCRYLTNQGTLRVKRDANTRLWIKRANLIIEGNGIFDWGTDADTIQSGFTATVSMTVNESGFVMGGANDDPTPVTGNARNDHGIWGRDNATFFVAGQKKDRWTKLAAQANSGASTITVKGLFTFGWAVNDEIVIASTFVNTTGVSQSERLRIKAITGNPGDATRVITLGTLADSTITATLANTHLYFTKTWTDKFSDTWADVFTAAVANLTANVIFESVDDTGELDGSNRSHFMTLDNTKCYMQDFSIKNFSPAPIVNPAGRYSIHVHRQGDGSRGSLFKRFALIGGPGTNGGGMFLHESFGPYVEDGVFYKTATTRGTALQTPNPFWPENTLPIVKGIEPIAFVDGRAVRLCFIDWGTNDNGDFRNSAVRVSGGANSGIMWIDASGMNGDRFSAAVAWPEGEQVTNEQTHIYKIDAYSNRHDGLFFRTNNSPRVDLATGFPFNNPGRAEAIVDVKSWNNGDHGEEHGAYATNYHLFHCRYIGNDIQAQHTVARRRMTNFLFDGNGRADAIGVSIIKYELPSSLNTLLTDSVYTDGVIQDVSVNVQHGPTQIGDGIITGAELANKISWVQFNRTTFASGASPPLFFARPTGGGGVDTDGTNDGFVPPQSTVDASTGVNEPIGSYIRFRTQTGLTGLPTDFDLYRLNETRAPATAVADGNLNALRDSNVTAGAWPTVPRIKMALPLDEALEPVADAQGLKNVAGTIETNAATGSVLRVYEVVSDPGLRSPFLTVTSPTSSVPFVFPMHLHSSLYRYAILVASVETTAVEPAADSRPIRNFTRPIALVRPLFTAAAPAEPVAPVLTSFTAPVTIPPSLVYVNTDPNTTETGYAYETAPALAGPFTERVIKGADSLGATWDAATPPGPTTNTTYFGRVSAIGQAPTFTRYSSNVLGPITTPDVVPVSPDFVSFTGLSVSGVTANFVDRALNETGFDAQYRVKPGIGEVTPWIAIDPDKPALAGTGLTFAYVLSSLLEDKTYQLQVWAKNATGISVIIEVEFTTLQTPPDPEETAQWTIIDRAVAWTVTQR